MKHSLARKILLLLGDWLALYLSLFLLVFLRYGSFWQSQWGIHVRPFSLLFPLWLVSLYASYLYETRFMRPSIDALRAMGIAIFLSFFGSMSVFYLFPPGLIQPRRNLVFFAIIFGVVLSLWRFAAHKVIRSQIRTNVLFIGEGNEIKELIRFFNKNPELNYRSLGSITDTSSLDGVVGSAREKDVGLIVVKSSQSSGRAKSLFPLMASGIPTIDLEEFYERIFNKVSPGVLDQAWFIRNLENVNTEAYKFGKRFMDLIIALIGTAILAILFIPIALVIGLSSRGPIIFKQNRVGVGGRTFKIYKFRTMKALSSDGSAELGRVKWTKSNDDRITPVGRFLRVARIDELPQFWNILMGDLSFVGPRPERPEFVAQLQKTIPHYNMRHLVKPGLTGWAQINYRYGSSVRDAYIKLQYDIYYAKKRSMILDLAIILKTLKVIVTGQGR